MIEVKNYANGKHWKALVAHYADGRPICNCADAYYSKGGKYWRDGVEYNDGLYCDGGCQANQFKAQNYVCKRIVEDLNGQEEKEV
jgi:hypothetical protein